MIKKTFLLGLIIFSWWYSRGVIKAQNIECYTQYGLCSDEIVTNLQWLQHTPLLFPLPHGRLSEQFSAYPQIKSSRLHRRLPKTIVVSLDLRKPMGTIGSQVLGSKALADSEGVIIGLGENPGLPQLISDQTQQPYQVGDHLGQPQTNALQILADVGEISGRQVLGRLDGNHLEIILSDNIQILINPDFLDQKWKSTLQLILDRSKIQAKTPKTIDLRFSSPVLKY